MPPQPADPNARGHSTRAVHAGERRPYPYHTLTPPIAQTATYTFKDSADLSAFMDARMWGMEQGRSEYGRYGNPTVSVVEDKIAALEGAQQGLLFASGMAAVTCTLLSLLSSGQHMIITDDSYRRTRQFCLTFLKRLGIECSEVPAGDYQQMEAAIRPETRLIVSESPTNPYLRVLDLERLVEIAQRHKLRTLIDSTFATPLNQQPLRFGIDLVLHSATKYLAGHNDVLGGALLGDRNLIALVRQNLWVLGAVIDPHAAYLIHRGLKSLALRVERQNQTALRVARFLEAQPLIRRVWYPGLESHPDHEIARSQMNAYGGVVSFEFDGDLQATSRWIDALQIPLIAPSLGGMETLIEQPALMSYYELSSEERMQVGIRDNLVRLALGVEDADDLIADFEAALTRLT